MPNIDSELTVFAKTLHQQLGTKHLNQLAQESSFSKRVSPFQGKDLVAMCALLSQAVVTDSLFQLCANLEAESGISMTPQALNERFNPSAVTFLKSVFHSLLLAQTPEVLLPYLAETSPFSRIRLLDATSFLVPDSFRDAYQGSGGTRHTAGVKIQLEYELLSGQFPNVDVGPKKGNDKTYGVACAPTIRKGDLCLRDLGYFDLSELDSLNEQGAFYSSRVKVNTSLFVKNDTPEVFESTGELKKRTRYTRLDLEPFLTELASEQTVEISEVYGGRQSKISRPIIPYDAKKLPEYPTITVPSVPFSKEKWKEISSL